MPARQKNINRDGFFEEAAVQADAPPDDFLQTLSPALMDGVGYGGQLMPVVQHKNGVVEIGSFRLNPTGMVITAEVTREEWEAFYRGIQKIRRAMQWIVGDWMLYGAERGWVTSYEDMATLTGLKDVTVKNYTYVCRSIPASLRSDKLSFAHFQEVAPLEDGVKAEWLNHAVKNKLSVRQLRQHIRRRSGLPDEATPALLDKSNRKRFGKLWRLAERNQSDKIKRDDIRLMRAWLDELEKIISG